MEKEKHPFEGLVIKGSKAPTEKASRDDIEIKFSPEMMRYYIPAWKTIEAPRGLKYLALIMAQMEGFTKGSRSFKTNNPGNLGNTDNGQNRSFRTLAGGIAAQIEFLRKVAEGKEKNYPLGSVKKLRPYYSPEIARNRKTYQLEPFCPGYIFDPYTGRLDEFIKIYSTGARQKNTYLSVIRSYFKNLGFEIEDGTTLAELIEL